MKRLDPRYCQILALTSLLAYGLVFLHFDITVARSLLIVSTALSAQWIWTRAMRLPKFDPKSALISALSLCLLLRTNFPLLAGTAAVVAISSKFIFRYRRKHIFNPTNISLVMLMLLADDRVWVSPGQWGQGAFFGFLLICLGGWVVNRASRSDVTLAFFGFYLLLICGRSWWLGEPMTIPLHRLQSGALLLFGFFMISDPKTTPDSRVGRLVFAALVAAGAAFVQFKLFRTNGLLWSLAVMSLATPALDWLSPGDRYQWKSQTVRAPLPKTKDKQTVYEPAFN